MRVQVALPGRDLCIRNQLGIESAGRTGREGMNLRMKEKAGCVTGRSPLKCLLGYNLWTRHLGNHGLNTVAQVYVLPASHSLYYTTGEVAKKKFFF